MSKSKKSDDRDRESQDHYIGRRISRKQKKIWDAMHDIRVLNEHKRKPVVTKGQWK